MRRNHMVITVIKEYGNKFKTLELLEFERYMAHLFNNIENLKDLNEISDLCVSLFNHNKYFCKVIDNLTERYFIKYSSLESIVEKYKLTKKDSLQLDSLQLDSLQLDSLQYLELSQHKDLTLDFVKLNPYISWHFDILLKRFGFSNIFNIIPAFRINNIVNNLNYDIINIPLKYVCENPDIGWPVSNIIRNASLDDLEKNLEFAKTRPFAICENKNVTIKFILEHPEIDWHQYDTISEFCSKQEFNYYPDFYYNIDSLVNNENLSVSIIIKKYYDKIQIFQPYHWSVLSSNATIDDYINYPDVPWVVERLYNFPFEIVVKLTSKLIPTSLSMEQMANISIILEHTWINCYNHYHGIEILKHNPWCIQYIQHLLPRTLSNRNENSMFGQITVFDSFDYIKEYLEKNPHILTNELKLDNVFYHHLNIIDKKFIKKYSNIIPVKWYVYFPDLYTHKSHLCYQRYLANKFAKKIKDDIKYISKVTKLSYWENTLSICEIKKMAEDWGCKSVEELRNILRTCDDVHHPMHKF